MALRIRTHTEYDFKHVEELQRVVSKAMAAKVARRNRVSNLLWGAVGLLAAVLIAVQTTHWIIAGILGALSLFLIARGVFFYQFVALGVRHTMDKGITGSDYILEKSYMLVINDKGSNQFAYADCDRLLETEGNLYYITKDGQGLILDKANLKGGTVDDLRAWMEEKCGKKIEWMGKKPKEA